MMRRLMLLFVVGAMWTGCAAPPRDQSIEQKPATQPADPPIESQAGPTAKAQAGPIIEPQAGPTTQPVEVLSPEPLSQPPAPASQPVAVTLKLQNEQIISFTCSALGFDVARNDVQQYASMTKQAAAGQTTFIPVVIGETRAYLDITYNRDATQVWVYLRGPAELPDLSFDVEINSAYSPADEVDPESGEQLPIVQTYLGARATPLIRTLLDLCDGKRVYPSRTLYPNASADVDNPLNTVCDRATLFVPGGQPPIEVLSLRIESLPDAATEFAVCPDEPVAAQAHAGSKWSSAAWNRRFEQLQGMHHRLAERGNDYNWQHAKELLALVAQGYGLRRGLSDTTPGPIRIGEPLSFEHARMWATLMGLSGQTILIGDAPNTLTAERSGLLRAIMPRAPIQAYSLNAEPLPELWNLSIDAAHRAYHVVGAFNWSSLRRTQTLVPQELGIVLNDGEWLAAYDFWEQRLLAVTQGYVDIHLPARSCRAICLVPIKANEPALISTNRHITQGATDVSAVSYDAAKRELRGQSTPLAGHAYELRLYVPTGEDGLAVSDVEANARWSVRRDGPLVVVAFDGSPTELTWCIRFEDAVGDVTTPNAPIGLQAAQTTRGVALSWQPSDYGVARYRIYRDDERVAEVGGHESAYRDMDVVYGETYYYAVSVVDALGRESELSPAIAQVVLLPGNTNLSTLQPVFVEQEHAWLGIDQTVDRNPLRVNGRRYYTGIGTHTHSQIRFYLGGGYDVFSGEVGVDDEVADNGSVQFAIVVDGQHLWSSETLHGTDGTERFEVEVTGKRFLDLIVNDSGDGSAFDHADWLNPYLRVMKKTDKHVATIDNNSQHSTGQAFPVTQPAGDVQANEQVAIETSLGTIVIVLDTDRTPRTIRNFLEYVEAGSYDGTLFHRVIDDFIVQGGGYDMQMTPQSTAPPIANEAEAARSNERGTIAMVRLSENDAARREFFFNLADNKQLDYPNHGGGYCVFGRVVEGMDVLDKISDTPVSSTTRFHYVPVEPVLIYTIRRD